jgi:hypothetical protein
VLELRLEPVDVLLFLFEDRLQTMCRNEMDLGNYLAQQIEE